jgi:hypothetical protein
MIIVLKFIIPLLILISIFYKILDATHRMSKSALVLLLIAIIFNISLAQNYNYSLIQHPERDGYSISNSIAYYVFGEDHFGHWNSNLFKSGYDISTSVTILFFILYITSLVIERKNK